MIVEILITLLVGGTIFAYFYLKKNEEQNEKPVEETAEVTASKKKSKAKKPVKKQNVILI